MAVAAAEETPFRMSGQHVAATAHTDGGQNHLVSGGRSADGLRVLEDGNSRSQPEAALLGTFEKCTAADGGHDSVAPDSGVLVGGIDGVT